MNSLYSQSTRKGIDEGYIVRSRDWLKRRTIIVYKIMNLNQIVNILLAILEALDWTN